MTARVDRNGNTTAYVYDAPDQLTRIDYTIRARLRWGFLVLG